MSRSFCTLLLYVAAGTAILVATQSERTVSAKAFSTVPRELLESRLDAARKVFELNLQKIRTGEAALDLGFLQWSQRWLEAELAIGDNRAGRVAAIKAHLERVKELEKIATAHMKVGQGRESDAQAATYFRIDAEIHLRQATSE